MKLKQLHYEAETWKRSLAIMKEQNNHMKNRLSKILKDRFYITLLEEVDNLQGRCIHTDEMISSLRNDVTELNRLGESASYGSVDHKRN